jgi:FkbM family methyltransferase
MKNFLSFIYKKIVKIFGKTKLTKINWIMKLNNHLRSKLKPEFIITKNGNKLFLDNNDSLHLSIYNNWERENFEAETMKKIIKKGDIVLDLGAHIGYYTLILAELVGAEGKVYAFEPDPMNFSLLEKNITVNNFKNVILIQKAVSDKVGKVKFYLNKEHSASNSLYKDKSHNNFVEVETVKLDDYFKDFNKEINFMKIDVEGAEGSVIIGAKNLLRRSPNLVLITEICPPALENSEFGQKNYLELLKKNNFKLYYLNEEKETSVPMTVEEVIKINPYTKNLLCIKQKDDMKKL